MLIAAILVALLAFAGVLACSYALHTLHREQHRTLRAEIVSRIGNHGIWVGAWLIGIDADKAEPVKASAVERAGPDGHRQILDLWTRAGGRVLTHVTGPDVVSEAEACGWLAHASDALTGLRVPEPLDHGREEVFALVYASTSPPPVRTRAWHQLQAFMSGPGVLGAAFVACPGAGGRARTSWRMAAIGLVVLLFAGLIATTIAVALGVSLDERAPPRAAATIPMPVPPAPQPAPPTPSAAPSATATPTPKPGKQ